MASWLSCFCDKQTPTIHKHPIEEDYKFLDFIGKGKTCTVFRGICRLTNDYVAIKLVSKAYLTTESRRNANQQEIQILSKVSHPVIISLKDVYEEDDRFCFVTEIATGGEVMKFFGSSFCTKISEQNICDIIQQVTSALAYLHSKGITHRDVKPENIIFSTANAKSVRLIDFGVSHTGRAFAQDMTGMNGTGHFMAPEIFGKNSRYGCKIDLWSLGVTTYTMLFGCFPFDGKFLSQLEDNIVGGKFKIPTDLVADVSDEAIDFIKVLLVRNPEKRPTAVQLLKHPWLKTSSFRKRKSFNDVHFESIQKYSKDRLDPDEGKDNENIYVHGRIVEGNKSYQPPIVPDR